MKKILLVNQTIGPLFQDIILSLQLTSQPLIFKSIGYSRNSFPQRLFTWSFFTIHLILHLSFHPRSYDHILFVSNPPFSIFATYFTRHPFSLLIYDLYPLALRQLPLPTCLLTIISSLWIHLSRRAILRSRTIFVLSDSMRDALLEQYSLHLSQVQIKVVPPWSHLTYKTSTAAQLKSFRSTYAIPASSLLVSYSGNIGITHPLEHILYSGALFSSQYASAESQQIHFFFAGSGQQKAYLVFLQSSLRLPTSTFRLTNSLTHSEYLTLLSTTQLAVVALNPLVSSCSLPSKLFNYLTFGIPILAITSPNSSLGNFVSSHQCGFVVEPNEHAGPLIFELLHILSHNPALLAKLSRNSFQAASHYTSKNALTLSTAITAE